MWDFLHCQLVCWDCWHPVYGMQQIGWQPGWNERRNSDAGGHQTILDFGGEMDGISDDISCLRGNGAGLYPEHAGLCDV